MRQSRLGRRIWVYPAIVPLVALAACEGTISSPTDTPDGGLASDASDLVCELTCSGCCEGGLCHSGDADARCGKSGAACVSCTAKGTTCSSGRCGSCTAECAGKCSGASDGCGGSCSTNTCVGCCDARRVCQPGNAAGSCGWSGADCADCTALGTTCSAGRCASCTPQCSGKCDQGSDGCGGTCPTNSCPGCCDASHSCHAQSSNAACGLGGKACMNCLNLGQTCSGGMCVGGCSPNCSGRCQGAADGCGGVCPQNTCSGCCDSTSTCHPGTQLTACGSGGKACTKCGGSDTCSAGICKSAVSTTCSGSYAVTMKVYLHPTVSSSAVPQFLSMISTYLQSHGIGITVSQYGSTVVASSVTLDSSISGGADLALFVSPTVAWEGYMGPPYYYIEMNATDPALGFTQSGAHATAHEIMHFLGFQDLYILTDEALASQPWVKNDLMKYPFVSDPPIGDPDKRIACFNLNLKRAGDKYSIYYPNPEPVFTSKHRTRFQQKVTFNITVPVTSQACSVYRMYYGTSGATYETSPVLTAVPDGSGSLKLNADMMSWYAGFKIQCGSSKYFLVSIVFDDCFFKNGAQTVSACSVKCTTAGAWCEVN